MRGTAGCAVANPLKPCPDCGEPAGLRGTILAGDSDAGTYDAPCPHPCHAAAQKIVEAAVVYTRGTWTDNDEYARAVVLRKARALLAALEEE